MSRRMLGRIACAAGLAATLALAAGCEKKTGEGGAPVPPQSMGAEKQKQMEDYFKSKAPGGGGGAAPGGAPGKAPGGAPAPAPTMPHG